MRVAVAPTGTVGKNHSKARFHKRVKRLVPASGDEQVCPVQYQNWPAETFVVVVNSSPVNLKDLRLLFSSSPAIAAIPVALKANSPARRNLVHEAVVICFSLVNHR